MKVDDITLMAYVDGELDIEERREIERELDESPELAERIELFRASSLPYDAAFAQQKLPPVPESLTRKIAELARTHASATSTVPPGPAADPAANDASVPPVAGLPPSVPVRSRMRFSAPWLAVAFVAGVFCCGIGLRLVPGVFSGGAATVASAQPASPWVMAAAGYQALYSRDTVAVTTDAAVSAKTVADIHEIDGLPVRVPDLSAQGLTFKRIQRLRFHDKPLVQIVYLPKTGGPVALCVVKDAKPDQSIAQQKLDGMDVVTWRQSELSYALIGTTGQVDLDKLGKLIAKRDVDAMFGQTTAPVSTIAS
ncbi:anti-sigma factor [Burkholderia sp. Ac-20365]|jgi:anti-sigma factor RsiW|uniref:anti-sigma factor n=1 Tax=Burkholderia sp. Ac-20365 TaxID=2703897 RepID=UPI00197B81EC|nr:anti-sigma factor [Burkholderia sp. Ac-20365]MBN3759808.1 anti-sigma factor [Burkholderia sp. Ac-20365]